MPVAPPLPVEEINEQILKSELKETSETEYEKKLRYQKEEPAHGELRQYPEFKKPGIFIQESKFHKVPPAINDKPERGLSKSKNFYLEKFDLYTISTAFVIGLSIAIYSVDVNRNEIVKLIGASILFGLFFSLITYFLLLVTNNKRIIFRKKLQQGFKVAKWFAVITFIGNLLLDVYVLFAQKDVIINGYSINITHFLFNTAPMLACLIFIFKNNPIPFLVFMILHYLTDLFCPGFYSETGGPLKVGVMWVFWKGFIDRYRINKYFEGNKLTEARY